MWSTISIDEELIPVRLFAAHLEHSFVALAPSSCRTILRDYDALAVQIRALRPLLVLSWLTTDLAFEQRLSEEAPFEGHSGNRVVLVVGGLGREG